ncbi:MAG: hypothetical protein ABSD70_15140 [Terracidiphilus sp.]|jgi:hypothetical protein
MLPISAADSVSLAVQRTRDFLFRPFSWGTYLKLGLVAILTEGLGSGSNSTTHSNNGEAQGPSLPPLFHLTPEIIATIVAAVLLALFLSAFVFYLITRLRFAFFHCLIQNTREIRPGWRLYERQAARFFWLNIVVGICFILVMILVALPFAAGFWRVFQQTQHGGHLDIGSVLVLVLPLIPVLIAVVIAGILTDLILRDWMLPHFALDDATAGEAWAQVWTRIKAEQRQFLVYALLRVVLPIIAMIALFAVLILPGLVLAGSVAAVEFGLHSMFADATGASAIVGIALQVFFGVVAVGFALFASICLGGPVSTGIREYALIFYGGRYRALGDILYPPASPDSPKPGAPQLA